jgi:hypothetical protein
LTEAEKKNFTLCKPEKNLGKQGISPPSNIALEHCQATQALSPQAPKMFRNQRYLFQVKL